MLKNQFKAKKVPNNTFTYNLHNKLNKNKKIKKFKFEKNLYDKQINNFLEKKSLQP